MVAERRKLVRAAILIGASLEESEKKLYCPTLQPANFSPRVRFGHLGYASDLLRRILEEISVCSYLDDFKAEFRKMLFVEIPVEPGCVMMRGKVRKACKRRCKYQLPPRPQQSGEFLQGRKRFRDMFEDFCAKDCLKGGIRLRNGSDIANDIEAALVPLAHLQTLPVTLAVILSEVLGNILEVSAKSLVRPLAGPGIEKAGACGNLRQCALDPPVSNRGILCSYLTHG